MQQALFARKPSQDVVALLDAVAADVRPNSVRIALEAIAAADLRHVLPQIEVPTLLVWGELDARSPLSVAREFARLIPHAQLGRVPHWSRTGSADDDDVHDRHDLTDEQWDLLEPHLPRSVPGKAGRPWSDHRSVVNAVLWRTRAGAAWRDVPTGYGPWKTAYNRHRRWSGDGTWERLLSELQRGSDTGTASWDVGIDSTVIRAHQHAAGAPHTPPSDVPAERLAVAVEDFDSTRARPRPRHTGGWLPVHPLPGISDLPEDGTFGPWTMAALMSFQENNRLEVTGRLDRSTRDVLLRRSKESTLPSVKAGPHEPRDDELLRAKLCGDLFD